MSNPVDTDQPDEFDPLERGAASPADVLDSLQDIASDLWWLVDVVTPLVHAEQDGPRRLELRAVQEHTAQAWAQAQHAVTVLQTLVALDVPKHEQPGWLL